MASAAAAGGAPVDDDAAAASSERAERVGGGGHQVAPSSAPAPSHEDVLSFWFGDAWPQAVRDPLAWPGDANKKWFFGGAAVDEEVKARFLPLLEAFSARQNDGGGGGGPPSSSSSSCCTRWLDDDLAAAAATAAEPSSPGPEFLPLRALAGIIVLDQFSRHAYRGTARAFALDAEALRWSRALGRPPGGGGPALHRRLAPAARLFALLPFEHSEDPATQGESVALFEEMASDAREAAANATAGAAAGSGDEAAAAAAAAASAAAALLVSSTQGTLDFARKHRDAIERWGRFPGRNAALGRESTAEEAEGLASGAIAKW